MNLLSTRNYDPDPAVTASTASRIAMTAIDTTNLRNIFTIPSHGMIFVRMEVAVAGGASIPSVMLGVMVGGTVVGRLLARVHSNGTTAKLVAEFTVSSGLGTIGTSCQLDAAYGVEVEVGSSALKWGGPNDTTSDNAWGGFQFSVFNPRPIPIATPGDSGGLIINGINSGTIGIAGINLNGQMNFNDDVNFNLATNMYGGLSIGNATTNGHAVLLYGNGTGAGLYITSDGTGDATALKIYGRGEGHGVEILSGNGTSSNGLTINAMSTDGHGMCIVGAGGGDGIYTQGGGSAGGDGIHAEAGGGVSIRGSINGSVGSVSGLVGSVTGNVGGNVTGSVGSVVGNVGGNVLGTVDSVVNAPAVDTAAIADAVWDEARAGHVGAGTFGQGVASVQGNVTGSVGSVSGAVGSVTAAVTVGSVNPNALTASLLAADAVTEIQSGLATSSGVTDLLTDIADIQARLPAALVAGRMDSYVGAMAANTVTAAALATNAIDLDSLAPSAITEIQTGLLTPSDITTLSSKVDTLEAVALGRWKVISNQLVLYELDGTTPLATFDLKDADGNPSMVRIFERVPA